MNGEQGSFGVDHGLRDRVKFGDFDTGFLAQVADRFRKSHAFHFHDKSKNVAALVATKTMPNLPFARDVKARRTFAMKRANSLKTPTAGWLQSQIFAQHFGDVELLTNFIFWFHHTKLAQLQLTIFVVFASAVNLICHSPLGHFGNGLPRVLPAADPIGCSLALRAQ